MTFEEEYNRGNFNNDEEEANANIVGAFSKDAVKEMNMDKCSRCESKEVCAILEIPAKKKGLPFTKMIPACKKCMAETGVILPTKEQTENNTI